MTTFSQLGPHSSGNGQATDGRHYPLGDGIRQPSERAKPLYPCLLPAGILKARPATKALGYTTGANLAVLRGAVPTGRCGCQTGLSLGTRTPGLPAHNSSSPRASRCDSDQVTCWAAAPLQGLQRREILGKDMLRGKAAGW